MNYRKLSTITKEEVSEFIIKALHPISFKQVGLSDGSVEVEIQTEWSDEEEPLIMTDVVELCSNGDIYIDFYQKGLERMWLQFLIAKGFHWMYRDNPFINNDSGGN